MGSASKWWLHHSLGNLNKSLNNNLSIYVGDPQEVLGNIINNFNVESVNWNRCYEPWRIQRDQNIKSKIEKKIKYPHTLCKRTLSITLLNPVAFL